MFADVGAFSRTFLERWSLRTYQVRAAQPVVRSILTGAGESFVWEFSRQSGKDETLAQLLAYLGSLYQVRGASVVIAHPTQQPQAAAAMRRLEDRLADCLLTPGARIQDQTIIRLGHYRANYLSGEPTANVRGATASLLLVANEAQDIEIPIWDARFAPMGAAFNATQLYIGTSWTSNSLLAREKQALIDAGKPENIIRITWDEVAKVLPAYGKYVEAQRAKMGASNPLFRTEYDLVELDDAGGLFPADLRDLMRGDFPLLSARRAGERYAATLDVAGESEEQIEGEIRTDRRQDSTVLSIFRINDSTDELSYELVHRYSWRGIKHTSLYQRIAGLADTWRLVHLAVDATGVGAGLASFLERALGERRVTRFTFTSKSKSDIGWNLIGMTEAGRFRVGTITDDTDSDALKAQLELDQLFWQQTAAVRYSVLPGPGKLMNWEVPSTTLHDDLIVSAAMVSVLDEADLRPRTARGT